MPGKISAHEITNMAEEMPCGILSINDDGIITYVNSTFASFLLQDPEDILDKKLEQILTVAGRIFYQTHLFPIIKLHGRANEIYISFLSSSKKEIPVLLNAIREEKDETAEIHFACFTVFQRKKYEDEILAAKRTAEDALNRNEELLKIKNQLEENKKEIDRQNVLLRQMNGELIQFNQFISHDLLEPLRKIMLFTDILQRENKDGLNEKSLRVVNRINKSASRMRELILNLQDLVSLEADRTKLSSVSLAGTIEHAIKKIQLKYPDEKIHLRSESLPLIDGYEEQLQKLFYFLIDNSVKFKNPDQEANVNIECTVVQKNTYQLTKEDYDYTEFVKIIYSDNGIGFDNRYNDYVFQILKKLDLEQEGLGFGLAFSKKIVQNHFGNITVESKQGVGSRFTILLPVSQK